MRLAWFLTFMPIVLCNICTGTLNQAGVLRKFVSERDLNHWMSSMPVVFQYVDYIDLGIGKVFNKETLEISVENVDKHDITVKERNYVGYMGLCMISSNLCKCPRGSPLNFYTCGFHLSTDPKEEGVVSKGRSVIIDVDPLRPVSIESSSSVCPSFTVKHVSINGIPITNDITVFQGFNRNLIFLFLSFICLYSIQHLDNMLLSISLGSMAGPIIMMIIISIFIIKKTGDMTSSWVPFIPVSSMVSVIIMTKYYDIIFKSSLEMLIYIWTNGVFDNKNLGKAIIVIVVVISAIIIYRFNLFREVESSSFRSLRMAVLLTSSLFFFYGMYGLREIAYFGVACILLSDYIIHALWTLYLVTHASNNKLTRKMTMSEYDRIGKLKTEKELEKLKKHLNANPQTFQKYDASSGMNQSRFASSSVPLIESFMRGHYPGLPEKDPRGGNKKSWCLIL